ncbi:MAG: aldo/keto reductase family protein, partial [Verrucomicrobiota bacterium]
MNLVLGTMTFGPQVNRAESEAMLRRFLASGHREVDAAYVYNGGDTERILGEVFAQGGLPPCTVATKVNPRVTGRLDREAVLSQLDESLARMKRDSVDVLYLHFPDPNTPVETTLSACAELHQQGKFKQLGLSNFAAWQVVDIWHLCQREGWPLPVVYQGLYNGLSRGIEPELLPALRHLGMRFYAYNPLAGGILAGKYKDFSEEPAPGRFTHRPNYRSRYWKKPFFDAVTILTETCTAEGIPLVQAAYRWLAHHSGLDAARGDAVILGASSLAQLEQNLNAFDQQALPDSVVEAFEDAWLAAKPECPDYFR